MLAVRFGRKRGFRAGITLMLNYRSRKAKIFAGAVALSYVICTFSCSTVFRLNSRPDPRPLDSLHMFSASDLNPRGIELCLSGGGYRAMLFHAGVLKRLNDAGILNKLDEISSVSGGAIAAGLLAARWRDLRFNDHGVAVNFDALILAPLIDFAGTTIDLPAIVKGIAFPQSSSATIVAALKKRLYGGQTLQDLPERPRFVFHATDLVSGDDWEFSQDEMGDDATGYVYRPNLDLAVAVAASAAFPPFLSPVTILLENVPLSETFYSARARTFDGPILLADGGVWDNLGLSTHGNYQTLLVSDASGRAKPSLQVGKNWLSQTKRVIDLIYDQPGQLRTELLMQRYINNLDNHVTNYTAYWSIRNGPVGLRYDSSPAARALLTKGQELAEIPTRLRRLDEWHSKALVKWGYIVVGSDLNNVTKVSSNMADVSTVFPEIQLQ